MKRLLLPHDYSAKIARETQKFLQQNTDITKYIDPWAGSALRRISYRTAYT